MVQGLFFREEIWRASLPVSPAPPPLPGTKRVVSSLLLGRSLLHPCECTGVHCVLLVK